MSPRRPWKPSRFQIFLLAFVGVLAALALMAVGIAAWAGAYLRGVEFRELLAGHAGNALRGRAEFKPLRWDGSGVFCEGFRFDGSEASALSSLEARQLRAEVDWRSVFSGAWKVRSVEMQEVEAALQPQAADAPQPDTSSLPLPRSPFRVEIGGFRATRASLDFGKGGEIRDTQLLAEKEGQGWAFVASGGRFLVSGWPEISVDKLRGRVEAGNVHLTSGSGHLKAGGSIEASGEFSRESQVHLKWADVNLDSLLPGAWREQVHGTLSGNATLDFQHAGSKIEGRLLLGEGRLRDVPLLSQIATFTGSPQFRRMPLQEVSANFRHDQGGWTFSDVVLESKGLLRMTGRCAVSPEGGLDGELEVGVASQVLQWIPGSRERVFTRNEQGYVWTSMRLGGTVDNPREDLSPRLAAAARDEVIQRGSEILDKPAEAARGILEALSPLFR